MMNPFFRTPPPPTRRRGRWRGPSPCWLCSCGRSSCCSPRGSFRRPPIRKSQRETRPVDPKRKEEGHDRASEAGRRATVGGGENHARSAVGGAVVGRGGAADCRVPARGVLGSGFARRVGGAGYLSLKQFHSSRMRRWPWKNNFSRDWFRETA